ncbi:serine/threonine protein kinase [Hyalangium rubrum]|uniref:Protein kinase n=1 Tax=Hyalangium rubrum TaxID=3103134 RepID=A0ABU5H275_9BACT|nr:protein kinase [Hyalangium sp. s54d21]MDY7227556.1 protein kinase [Hyalangium sp. s54d21]
MTSSSPSARLRPFRPQPFGRYTLLSHLATGGMGEIYLARLEGAQGFEKLCVIKKILPQLAEDTEFVDRFVGEARTLVKLSHGSIAQVLDMGLHEGEAYMALEYVDGKDLRKVAGRVRDRQMPLPLTFILFVMARVLDALAYAHRKRDDDEKEIHLVHRDISPQNILISYEGEVKVIDFGLAKSRLSAAKTNPSIILGKFLYMSPEQARHQQVDRRSDLYAVGLCLYELISGKNPFDSVHAGDLMSVVANPRITPLSEVEPMTPPAVAQLVMKALAVEPGQRFQTAEEFRGRLQSCLLEIDPSAGPESVTRFMRDLFSAEYQSERKMLAQLKDVPRAGNEESSRSEESTDPAGRLPKPLLPPRTIKLDGPVEPLSFQPTPRGRDGSPVNEGDTRPGVPLEETRPAASVEALEVPRSRSRPALSATSLTTDTASVEMRPEAPERPPPPVPLAVAVAASASRSQALTVEVPIPLVPAAAIPPGVPPPAVTSPQLPRSLEAPRAAPPAASPSARPPAPPPAASAPRPPEPPRQAAPPPVPASALTPEPRSTDTVRANAPTIQIPTPFVPEPTPAPAAPPPPAWFSAPTQAPSQREASEARSAPPPEGPRTSTSAMDTLPPVRESGRVSASRAALAEAGSAAPLSAEALLQLLPSDTLPPTGSNRPGMDDTHPSYQMAANPAIPEDTQPRVMLDEAALSAPPVPDAPDPIIVGGTLEESSGVSRPKNARRPRLSSPGMAPVTRGGTSPRSGPVRAVEPESAPAPAPEEDGLEARDPREDTRKTPIPTRPGENTRRIHRDDTKRPQKAAPAKKRSWGWLLVTVLVLGITGGAMAMAFPHLKPLLNFKPVPVNPPPKSALGRSPLTPVPGAGASAPGAEAAPTPGGAQAPAVAEAATPGAETPEAEEPMMEDEMLVPLMASPTSAPSSKKAPARPSKKPARKEASELQKEWGLASRAFQKLTEVQSCESPKIGILCKRYETLQNDVEQVGDSGDKEVLGRVKKLRKDIQTATGSP